MSGRVVLPTRDGKPNNIEYDGQADDIVCISDEPLDIIDQRAVEGLLNVNTDHCTRGPMEERRMDNGKWFSTWSIVMAPDYDWN